MKTKFLAQALYFILASIALTAGTLPSAAAEMSVKRHVSYAGKREYRRSLDVYAPTEGKDHPVMIWIHGGAWAFGDKRGVQEKPQAFVDKGYVFVSINYRFVPKVKMDDIADDVATAVRWVYDHAADYGGSSKKIFIAGHSAGAHLAALVCTDPRYLKAHDMQLADIAGCVPVDTAVYDAARQISERTPNTSRIYTNAFGERAATQREFSPITYVEKDRGIPPFCLLYVARRPDSSKQAAAFAKALQEAGITVQLVAGENKTHETINKELGLPADKPTTAMFEFLKTK